MLYYKTVFANSQQQIVLVRFIIIVNMRYLLEIEEYKQ